MTFIVNVQTERYTRQEEQDILQHAMQHWNDFRTATIVIYGVPEASFNSFMARLERTGLYVRITGNYYDYSGDVGITTPLLARLKALVRTTPP